MISIGQTQNRNDLFAMNTTKAKCLVFKQDVFTSTNINLKLSNYRNSDDAKIGFGAILIAGIAFTAASLLEGGSQYGTWVFNTPTNATYKTPSFWAQTPRQLIFCAGLAMTIGGGIGLARGH